MKSNDGKFPESDERKSHTFLGIRVPSKRKPKRPIARHIIIEIAKLQDKERILKAAREKKEVNTREPQ